jgi:predicted amidohydrolase
MYEVHNNMGRLKALINQQITQDVDLLVLPELALTGYAYTSKEELSKVASPQLNKETTDFMIEIASKTGAHLVMGYPEAQGDDFYNSALICNKDGLIGNYRKTHLFGNEKDVYKYGDLGLNVFDTSIGRIGIMICFDWFFPESARTLALKGADIIAHPANLVMPYCQQAMFARSLENSVYTITANRCGKETWGQDLIFTGGSIIYDPRGNVLATGPLSGEDVKIVELDLEKARNKNLNRRNHIFKERHPEHYTT